MGVESSLSSALVLTLVLMPGTSFLVVTLCSSDLPLLAILLCLLGVLCGTCQLALLHLYPVYRDFARQLDF